jgi:hypothetical protein
MYDWPSPFCLVAQIVSIVPSPPWVVSLCCSFNTLSPDKVCLWSSRAVLQSELTDGLLGVQAELPCRRCNISFCWKSIREKETHICRPICIVYIPPSPHIDWNVDNVLYCPSTKCLPHALFVPPLSLSLPLCLSLITNVGHCLVLNYL